MNLDEVVGDLGAGGHRLPRESMQWALDHWDEAGPRFIAMLDAYSSGADRREETACALFFAIHLFGETADTAAYPALCRLLHDAEAAEIVLGDAITETLAGVLIRVFDGGRAPLQSVIEDAAADGFVRGAALTAMAYIAYEERVSESEMRGYLMHLLETLAPKTDEMLWVGWADAIANLGYQDFEPQVADVFKRGLIDPGITDFGWFRKSLRRTLDDPRRLAGFEADLVVPLTDAIGVLQQWHGFSEKAADQHPSDYDAKDPLIPGIEEPYINPFRHVGRNDPCPCGSGKKFKKCCLPGRV